MVKFVISVKTLVISGIALLVLLAIGIGVYAYNPSSSGNPAAMGHSLNEIAPPTPCAVGQYLQRAPTTLGWACVDAPAGGVPTVSCSGEDKALQWSVASGWTCATIPTISL